MNRSAERIIISRNFCSWRALAVINRATGSSSHMFSSLLRKSAATAALVAAAALGHPPAQAEGLVATPWGYRAASCCREYGLPGFQGRPPNEFLYGVLAPVFWGEIIPRLMERFPPPPAYAYAPPVYRRSPPPPAAAPPDREQWKQRLQAEGRQFCQAYPDDPVCGEGNK